MGAQREDIFSCAIFIFFRHYWTVCINHRPHAKKKGPAWRPRQNQGPHARIYDSTPELTISTPESRPPRQNFNLHADAPRQNLARQNVWQGDCGKECPTPEFTEATQRLFQHVVAWRLQLCCTAPAYGPVTTVHRACNYVAQDAYGCMGPAIMLHGYSIWLQRACTYAAQGQHVAAGSRDYASQKQQMAA